MAILSTRERLNDVLDAATHWKERCLLSDGSIFSDKDVWSPRNIDLLEKYFVQNPIEGKDSFLSKLSIQLKPADSSVKQLAAEMIWALLLFPSNISGHKKRESVLEALSWSGLKLNDNHPMLELLEYGVGSAGIAYFVKRPYELAFQIELLQSIKADGSPGRGFLKSSPWAFGNWVDNLPSTGKRQFRHMILYLLFPNDFERVSSTSEKQRIAEAFPELISSYEALEDDSPAIEVDRKLFMIRRGLQQRFPGVEIDFYHSPVKELWKPDSEGETPEQPHPPAEEEAATDSSADSFYSVESAIQDIFLESSDFEDILDTIRNKKNAILQGPPGVGKSFMAQEVAYALIKAKDPQRVKFVQFHQSYSYEDFIEGFRPQKSGGFELQKGLFRQFSEKAASDPQNLYVLVVDEINRGNLSKIFGELLLLIEHDKRSQRFALNLAYSKDSFYVPPNLYIIGLMNTADRSLALVDYALRRRFAFIPLRPQFKSRKFRSWLAERSTKQIADAVITRMSELNALIEQDTSLGSGFCIGHSFFCPGKLDRDLDENWFRRVVRTEIQPLLDEYWFDNPKHSKGLIEKLSASI